MADIVYAEQAAAALESCEAEWGFESIFIFNLKPSLRVSLRGDIKIPRGVAVEFAVGREYGGVSAFGKNFIEFGALVPEQSIYIVL